MPFIGNKPSAVPLTSADLVDGIITSAKIANDAVVTGKIADGTIVNADINASAGIVSSKLTGISSQPFRNIVINGDMQIAQRSTSVASITASGYRTLDRFYLGLSTLGTWTMSQSTDVPSGYGFAKSLKFDCTTADASPASGDNMLISQFFEGQNLQYLKKGTANAVSLTASFWVKSTKTGTFICELHDTDNSRAISKSYTVNTTNTWEFKTITFPGDTTGAFTNDNGDSLGLNFWLGAGTNFTSGALQTSWGAIVSANRAVGQVNIADSTANDFFITGVQLEAGTSATDFEFLPYDVNFIRCKRYFQKTTTGIYQQQGNWHGLHWSGTAHLGSMSTDVQMRTDPTLSYDGTWEIAGGGGSGSGYTPSGSSIHSSGALQVAMSGTQRASAHSLHGYTVSASSFIAWSAEL